MKYESTTRVRPAVLVGIAIVLAAAIGAAEAVTQPALRAAFLYNFAKFTEWPQEGAPGSLTLCVLDDNEVEGALNELVQGSTINGRPVAVSRGVGGAQLRSCHMVYLGEAGAARSSSVVEALQGAPILTVSNGDEFVRKGGVVGLFIEQGRMRFAVNPDAAQRAGVRLSSRLLQLAKILKDERHDR